MRSITLVLVLTQHTYHHLCHHQHHHSQCCMITSPCRCLLTRCLFTHYAQTNKTICLFEPIKSLFMYHTSKGRGQNRTHVELKFICPLSNQTVARVRGVGRLVLKDVIPPRGISVLVKHDWGASAPCRRQENDRF